jgi:hypothetical protein
MRRRTRTSRAQLQTARQWLTIGTLSVLVLAVAVPAALAAPWTEVGDAGSLRGTAQAVVGDGALTSISGSIGDPNDEDMYKICLRGGKRFSATTDGGATFDTQLFLFNASGRGVYMNDDIGGDPYNVQSRLPRMQPLTPRQAGIYFLAISAFDNDPVNARGQMIFPDEPFDVVHGPARPGARVRGWDEGGLESGSYTITLRGARFLEENGGNDDCD